MRPGQRSATRVRCGLRPPSLRVDAFGKGTLLLAYAGLHAALAPFEWDAGQPLSWATALIGYDFLYYWSHRLSHRIGFLWANHAVHHQTPDYHLAIGFRAGVLGPLLHEAQPLWQDLEVRHEQFMQALRADQRERARARWQEFLELVPKVDKVYQQVSKSLELALTLDPHRARTRALMSTLLEDRARLAEMMGLARERDQFVERLALYDRAAHARWSAPVPVAVDARPGAGVTIDRYEPDAGALIARAWGDGGIHTTPFQLELPPGSYLLTIQADATHAEVRYPLLVHPGMPT